MNDEVAYWTARMEAAQLKLAHLHMGKSTPAQRQAAHDDVTKCKLAIRENS
jgi:hypothetical protein